MASITPLTTCLAIEQILTDIEYRMMAISMQEQRYSLRSTEISNKYSTAMNKALTQDEDNLTYLKLNDEEGVWLSFEAEMATIHAQEKQLEQERLQLETQHQAYTKILESTEKIQDTNIKSDFKHGGD